MGILCFYSRMHDVFPLAQKRKRKRTSHGLSGNVHGLGLHFFGSSFGSGFGVGNLNCSRRLALVRPAHRSANGWVRKRRRTNLIWLSILSWSNLLPSRRTTFEIPKCLRQLQWLHHNPFLLLVVSDLCVAR